jgi:hypothetical protein
MGQTANEFGKQHPSSVARGSLYWNTQRLARAAQCLSERNAALRLDIQRELRKYGDELYRALFTLPRKSRAAPQIHTDQDAVSAASR